MSTYPRAAAVRPWEKPLSASETSRRAAARSASIAAKGGAVTAPEINDAADVQLAPPCRGADLRTLVRDLPGGSINSFGIDIKTVCHGLLRSAVNEHDAMKVKASNFGNLHNRKHACADSPSCG